MKKKKTREKRIARKKSTRKARHQKLSVFDQNALDNMRYPNWEV